MLQLSVAVVQYMHAVQYDVSVELSLNIGSWQNLSKCAIWRSGQSEFNLVDFQTVHWTNWCDIVPTTSSERVNAISYQDPYIRWWNMGWLNTSCTESTICTLLRASWRPWKWTLTFAPWVCSLANPLVSISCLWWKSLGIGPVSKG